MEHDPRRRFVRLGDEWYPVAAIGKVGVEDEPERRICVYDSRGTLIGKYPPIQVGELLDLMHADFLWREGPWRGPKDDIDLDKMLDEE